MLKFEFGQYQSIWSEEHFLGNCFSDSKFSLSGSVLVPWEKESLNEEMRSLFVSAPKRNFYCHKKHSARDHLSLGNVSSQCDYVYYISYEPKTDKHHIEL